MAQNPIRMSAEDIRREIRSLRDEIDRSLNRIGELASALYGRSRRRRLALPGEVEPEDSAPYVIFSNGWLRMASSLRQGIQRMDRTDRIFAERIALEDTEPAPIVQRAQETPPAFRVADDSMEELMLLYGESVNNAASQ